MINATKDLVELNSTLVVDLRNVRHTVASCQYVSGSGTVQVEAKNSISDVWFTPLGVVGGSAVAAQTGVGAVVFNLYGYSHLRVRKTVGTASCVVSLGVA